jgi:WD40 repeat protein
VEAFKLLLLSLLILTLSYSLSLTELWRYNTPSAVNALAVDDNGNVGIASDCAYLLDQNGNLINKTCGGEVMSDVSFLNGLFAFACGDGSTYLFNGTIFWKKLNAGGWTLDLQPNGFLACSRLECAYLDFNGNYWWDRNLGWIAKGPSVHDGYVYVGDYDAGNLYILRLTDGYKTGQVSYGMSVWNSEVCGDYLAVGTEFRLYLYIISDPSEPREIWSVGGLRRVLSVAFSSDCKYVAALDTYNKRLKIYHVNGTLVLDVGSEAATLDWNGNRVAVGLYNGTVIVYGIGVVMPTTTTTTTSAVTHTSSNPTTTTTVPIPTALALLAFILLERLRR